MGRTENRLFRIADDLEKLAEEERLVRAELDYHRSIHDDAVRDAAVSGHYIDEEEANLTGADVSRFKRRLQEIVAARDKLHIKRAKLLRKLN